MATAVKRTRPYKDVLGFENGYITLFQGDTFPFIDWFRASVARYNRIWGWYITSADEMPEDTPAELTPVRLYWEEITDATGELKAEKELSQYIDSILYPTQEGEYIGEIGERIEVYLTVARAISLEDDYGGGKVMHIFLDDLNNTYIWTTAAKRLEENKTYCIRGTVKGHNLYKGVRQTILTRCLLR